MRLINSSLKYSIFVAFLLLGNFAFGQAGLKALLKIATERYDAEEYRECLNTLSKAELLSQNTDEDISRIWDFKAACYQELDQNDSAEYFLKKGLDLYESGHLHYRYGMVLSDLNHLDEAKEHLSKAVDMDPSIGPAHYYLAKWAYDDGKKEYAFKEWEAALSNGILYSSVMLDSLYEGKSALAEACLFKSLRTRAAESNYGWSLENPIYCGGGKSGPARERAYLNLLRGGKGGNLTYKRLGSTFSQNPEDQGKLFGGMVDIYQIKYRNAKGKKKKGKLYINMYSYRHMMVPQGLFSEDLPNPGKKK